MSASDVRKRLRELRREGYSVVQTRSGHWCIRRPGRPGCVHTSGSPSCYRASKNLAATLRRVFGNGETT